MERASDRPGSAERAVLDRLRTLLHRLGIANDAQDRGSRDEAEALRRGADAGIRELIREHDFLLALYPGLEAEVGTRRLHDHGWSGLVDDVERRLRFVDPDRIPWDRVVHLQGRAGAVPAWVVALGGEDHREAETRLLQSLAGGGGVSQATPLGLRRLLGALRFRGLVRDAQAVADLGDRIAAVAWHHAAAAGPREPNAPSADWSLYTEDRLWPRFESAERDAQLWAAWSPSDEDVLGWALLTLAVMREHEELRR